MYFYYTHSKSQYAMPKFHFYQGQQNLLEKDTEGVSDEQVDAIKERIAELFNMKNIHFLFGSGTSSDAIPIMSGLFESVKINVSKLGTVIEGEFTAIANEAKNNLEDILGVLYAQRTYLEGIKSNEKVAPLKNCNDLIDNIETTIFTIINIDFSAGKPLEILKLYQSFFQKVALRNKDLSRINIFTTNNDLFCERALDRLNINYINGFNGGLNKFFNPAFFNYSYSKRMDTSIEKFEPVENMVYLYKLHGSINWVEDKTDSNSFFKIKEISNDFKKGDNILIYPTPAKQNKSLGSPYTELFREFQKKLLEPHGVLFIIGYSFSDAHVNNIIYQAMATNSSITVVILNDVEDKSIAKIEDSRIFRIFETDDTGEDTLDKYAKADAKEKLHFFSYIVKNILPDVNTFKGNDDALKNFLDEYNNKVIPKK